MSNETKKTETAPADASAKSAQNAKAQSLTMLAIIAGIVVAINVLGLFVSYGRFDVTRGDLYSLSRSSTRVMESLSDRMEIIAYFSEDLPPQFASTEREVRDLLDEYRSASSGNLVVRFIDPDTDALQEQAREDGVLPVNHPTITGTSQSITQGYRGLVIKYLGTEHPVPVIASSDGLEYELTMAMRQLTGDKLPVGILSGFGSQTLGEELASLRESASSYEFREVSGTEAIDPELRALMIVGPEEEISDAVLQNINRFVIAGGNLGVFGGSIKVNLPTQQAPSPPTAEPVDTHVNTLLETWGVRLEGNLVADPQCERVPMQGGRGQMPVRYPLIPIVRFDEAQQAHAAISGLPGTIMLWSSSVSVTSERPDGVRVTPLASSTEGAWTIDDANIPLQPRPESEWGMMQRQARLGTRAMVVAIEGHLPSAFPDASPTDGVESRVMVVGSAAAFSQGGGGGAVNPANALYLNIIDWLAAEDDLIAIRNKSVSEPRLDERADLMAAAEDSEEAEQAQLQAALNRDGEALAEAREEAEEARDAAVAAQESFERTQSIVQWGNALGIPLLLALFGVIRWRRRVAMRANVSL